MTTGNAPSGGQAVGDTAPAQRLVKQTTATGDGRGDTSRTITRGFAVPTDSGDLAILEPRSVTSDHDQISIEARLSTELLEMDLTQYREAGDVQREPTAYGAFRRILRDGRSAITLAPPAALNPPFTDREVVPLDLETESLAGDDQAVTLEVGLVEPRARDPIAGDGDTETIASTTETVAGGDTESLTISGTAPTEFGDYVAEVLSPDDSDSVVVSVSDAAVTLSFPTGTIAVSEPQLDQPPRVSDTGRRRVTLPVRLDSDGVRVLFAVGSRVEATAARELPDAPTETRDTLPGGELSATLDAPDRLELDGDYVLAGWSVTRDRPDSEFPYDADVELLEQR